MPTTLSGAKARPAPPFAQPKPAQKPWRPDYFSAAELGERGWTETALRNLASPHDRETVNPRYKSAAPMRFWLKTRIESIEASPEYQAFGQKRVARAAAHERRVAGTLETAGLVDFPSLFPSARAMRRKILFLAGPTNSGKSYAGFKALLAATTGTYLAPLRLLALEGQEQIESGGVPCDLITGEERVLRVGASHVASTIEMLDLDRKVEVVLIDEVQLLADGDRGWAWTQAVLGAPADLVIATGSSDAEPLLRRLAAITGDEFEVRHHERLTPLHAIDHHVKLDALEPGDAIIAFSRRDVLQWRERLQERKHKVAVIYGALGPEVRRQEAARFRSGDASILIATDAIGMGLNLPIRRVLFSALVKFDGIKERHLTPSEIKQIGGRAGRFQQHDKGFVGVVNGLDRTIVARALANQNSSLNTKQFLVQPPWYAVQRIAKDLRTTALCKIFSCAEKAMQRAQHEWYCPISTEFLSIAKLLDDADLPLRTRFDYIGVPVDAKNSYMMYRLGIWLDNHAANQNVGVPPLRGGDVPTTSSTLETLEQDAKLLTAYLWLALRFPSIYAAGDKARKLLDLGNQRISEALLHRPLQRTCRSCGSKLAHSHAFAICDKCHRSRRDDYDGYGCKHPDPLKGMGFSGD